jgi:hypothetical protein
MFQAGVECGPASLSDAKGLHHCLSEDAMLDRQFRTRWGGVVLGRSFCHNFLCDCFCAAERQAYLP